MKHRAHILVIDDDPSTLELIGGVLADEGYEVTSATSCKQALEIAASPTPPYLI